MGGREGMGGEGEVSACGVHGGSAPRWCACSFDMEDLGGFSGNMIT